MFVMYWKENVDTGTNPHAVAVGDEEQVMKSLSDMKVGEWPTKVINVVDKTFFTIEYDSYDGINLRREY